MTYPDSSMFRQYAPQTMAFAKMIEDLPVFAVNWSGTKINWIAVDPIWWRSLEDSVAQKTERILLHHGVMLVNYVVPRQIADRKLAREEAAAILG